MFRTMKIGMAVTVSLSILLFIILMIAGALYPNNWSKNAQELQAVEIVGHYSADRGEWQPYTGSVGEEHNTVYFKGHFSKDIDKNMLLILSSNNTSVEMRLNGETVYQFGQPGSYPDFARIPGSDITFFASPGITALDSVEFLLESQNKGTGKNRFEKLLTGLKTGYAYELYDQMFRQHGFPFLIGICIMLIGLFVCILSLLMWKKDRVALAKGISFSFFAFVGGMCIISDTMDAYLPLFFKSSILCNFVDVGPLFLIAPAFCYYIYANLKDRKTQGVLAVITIVMGLLSSVSLAAQIFGIADVYQMRYFIFLPGLIGVVIVVVCLSYEAFYSKIQVSNNTLFFVLPLFIAVGLDVINVYFLFMPHRIAFRVGIISTIVLQIYQLVIFSRRREAEIVNQYKLEVEMAQSRIAVVLSQIKPHFLFNSLTIIRYLCLTQPKQAGKVVEDFADYLRGNINSLTQTMPITLNQELTHLGYYLTIEQLRFPYVEIDYDLRVQDFKLPALTVQLLVENAIRHGVTKKGGAELGKVTIATGEDDVAYYLWVRDDGIGFDSGQILNDDHSHIGISNIRKRLWSMCGGGLTLESTPNVGTCATVTIPKKEKPNESGCH